MSLQAFQSALGRRLLASGADVAAPGTGSATDLDVGLDAREQALVRRLAGSCGFRFTVAVQRSWCRGRLASAAPLTFAVLPAGLGRRLLERWVSAGGGTGAFAAGETIALLDFIASALRDPSHALSVCRFEQAVTRAQLAQADGWRPGHLDPGPPGPRLALSASAAVVRFHGDPARILAAADGRGRMPPLTAASSCLLVAPGIPGLVRPASDAELSALSLLGKPCRLDRLLRAGHSGAVVRALLAAGVISTH